MLHGHTEIPNLHAEIINLPRPCYYHFFFNTYNSNKGTFPTLQETLKIKIFSDVNSLSTSQRRCFRVERFTFFLYLSKLCCFSRTCFTNHNNNLIVSHDVKKLQSTGTVVLNWIKNTNSHTQLEFYISCT